MQTRVLDVAVIGLGPRGLSVLERLHANAAGCLGRQGILRVHVVDPRVRSGGQVWRDDQDPELLMNTVASQITMFVDESVDCEGPLVPGPSLYEWTRFATLMGSPPAMPRRLLDQAHELGPDDYPSRALYGRYLGWVLEHLLATAPRELITDLHQAIAVDVRETGDGAQEIVLSDGETFTVDVVVLAQGHLPSALSPAEKALGDFATRNGLRYLPPGNPADVDLDPIAPDESTFLRGLGLNFFDYMAQLTVGRGGRFTRDEKDCLRYLPSGREPKLVAGSRRGVPYHARGENQKGAAGRHEPLFLTGDVIARLRDGADRGAPADFWRDLWPLIDLEVRVVYYTTLLREQSCTCTAESFQSDFIPMAAKALLECGVDPSGFQGMEWETELLERFGIPAEQRWNWADIGEPYGAEDLVSTERFQRWVRGHIRRDVREARLGNVRGPLKAALDVLRDLRNEIRLVVDHGGLSGDSYRDDLQRWYMPLNAFVSIGPPVSRVEELGALIDSGVVTLLGPKVSVRPDDEAGVFVVASDVIPDYEARVTTLVEARLPENDLRVTTDRLTQALLARGEARLHRIPIRGSSEVYETGGLAVTTRPYRMLDGIGRVNPRRFAFGVPTETVHWITAAGIRPWVNSVILGDSDAVARAAIATALDVTADLQGV